MLNSKALTWYHMHSKVVLMIITWRLENKAEQFLETDGPLWFLARDRVCICRVCLFVCPSVCHTDGSVKNGWGEDYTTFAMEYKYKFTPEIVWVCDEFPLSGGVKQGWGGENKLFASFMCRYLENGARYDQSILVMTSTKLHMLFRLAQAPRSMTLDDLELL